MKRKTRKAQQNAVADPSQMSIDRFCGCGGRLERVKSWELKGKGEGGTIIDLFQCNKCGGQSRRARKLPKKETKKQ